MKARRPSRAVVLLAACAAAAASAFQLPRHHRRDPLSLRTPPSIQRARPLEMAKRRRRKRKNPAAAAPPTASSEKAKATVTVAIADDGGDEGTLPSTPAAEAAAAPATTTGKAEAEATPAAAAAAVPAEEEKKPSAAAMAAELLAQEQMMYDEGDLTSFTPQKLEEDDRIADAARRAGYDVGGGTGGGAELEDFFDSREFLARKREKQMKDAAAAGKVGAGGVPTKKKIKRSDVKAYEKLLEMDPLADEDDSYFEDEGIDFISALLGDVEPGVGNDSDENINKSGKKVQKKTSFLGIGSGPLQVGHFIGALGVVLMAFVEYPGFPLTNLPDPLRGALQGGLGTIYLINAILAVIAALSAPSRGQSSLLWGAKTFAVGGIAYDQLMQIPTPEELAERARREEKLVRRRSGRRGRRGRQG